MPFLCSLYPGFLFPSVVWHPASAGLPGVLFLEETVAVVVAPASAGPDPDLCFDPDSDPDSDPGSAGPDFDLCFGPDSAGSAGFPDPLGFSGLRPDWFWSPYRPDAA